MMVAAGLLAACAGGTTSPAGTAATSGGAAASRTTSGSATGRIMAPEAFAIGPDGNVYFSDCPAQRVFRLASNGTVAVVAGSGPEGFDNGSFAGDGGAATQARRIYIRLGACIPIMSNDISNVCRTSSTTER